MKIAVIGSGSWGTALAQVLADNGHEVVLKGRNPAEAMDINLYHRNSKFFGDTEIHHSLKASTDYEIVKGADVCILSVPVAAIPATAAELASHLDKPVIAVNVAKGFDPETKDRLSLTVRRQMGEKASQVVSLIGPSHAEEVIIRLLTSVNAVCEDEEAARTVQELFANSYFRVYRNTDTVGAEIAAALKNIMAIASGILSGLKQGDNARAALMTRGLHEITRYGLYFGGKQETFLGLNGVGDLIVTCSSVHSRNFQAGLAIGRADDAAEFLKNNTKTTEGIATTKVVYDKAKELGIEMPITEAVYQVLYELKKPSEIIGGLMSRSLKSEAD